MLTIAGGIILAVLFFVFLPYLLIAVMWLGTVMLSFIFAPIIQAYISAYRLLWIVPTYGVIVALFYYGKTEVAFSLLILIHLFGGLSAISYFEEKSS